jgi:hypothetical protein
MYIRETKQKNKKTGIEYSTYRIVETYRKPDGKVRQHTLLNLGANFSIPKITWKELTDRIEDILSGQLSLIPINQKIENTAQNIAKLIAPRIGIKYTKQNIQQNTAEKDYHTVDINSLENKQIRHIGAEHIGLEMLKQLGINKLLLELKFNKKQINTAVGSIIGRLVYPGSERKTHKYLQSQSALDELLGCNFQDLSLDSFYNIADKLLKNKETIEKKLFQIEKNIFNLNETIALYDLTNTYFEGRCLKNKKASFGRSKEKRTDCPIVTLAMVLDSSGFPKKTEVFAGNTSEPKTLKEMIEFLGTNKPTVVLDAGISSDENITWLKENNYKYIVVSKKKRLEMPNEKDVILRHKKDYLIRTKLVKNYETLENELYCYSELKEKKEQGMKNKAEKRYEIALSNLLSGLRKKRAIKKYTKILERFGRIKEKYKQVSYAYDVTIIPDEELKNAIDIKWIHLDNKQKLSGVYCLRSNNMDLDEQALWDTYIMLTELESAFRSLKSELGLRPVYHQTTNRVDSHIFISVLAYHVLHMARCKLKIHGINESWDTIKNEFSTQNRITTTIKCENGKNIHIRKTSLPSPRQLEIYRALNISMPTIKTEKSIF